METFLLGKASNPLQPREQQIPVIMIFIMHFEMEKEKPESHSFPSYQKAIIKFLISRIEKKKERIANSI